MTLVHVQSNVTGWAAEINAGTPSRTPVDIKVTENRELQINTVTVAGYLF